MRRGLAAVPGPRRDPSACVSPRAEPTGPAGRARYGDSDPAPPRFTSPGSPAGRRVVVGTRGAIGAEKGSDMDEYPLIEHHGLIGDLQAAALVTADATIDWFCLCTFMYVDDLARAGRVDQARLSGEDARLRRPSGPVLGGDGPDGAPTGQSPLGVQAPCPDRRRHHPGREAQRGARGRRGRGVKRPVAPVRPTPAGLRPADSRPAPTGLLTCRACRYGAGRSRAGAVRCPPPERAAGRSADSTAPTCR